MTVHTGQAIVNNDGQLVSKRRIIGLDLWWRHSQNVTVPVLVLQPFTGKGGTTRRSTDQKPPGAAVAGLPDLITDPLEAEHRIEGVKRYGLDTVVGIGGSCSDKTRHRPRFTQTFFKNCTGLLFVIVEQAALINRIVKLPGMAVDSSLAKQGFHAKGARLVGDDRHDQLADFRITHQFGQKMYISHGCRQLALAGAGKIFTKQLIGLTGHRLTTGKTFR